MPPRSASAFGPLLAGLGRRLLQVLGFPGVNVPYCVQHSTIPWLREPETASSEGAYGGIIIGAGKRE